MLINFFLTLRRYKVPVTIRELMDLIAALRERVVYSSVDDFYLLARTCMVKDEKNYDKFDRAFSAYFKGLEDLHGLLESLIPDEWLRREFEKSLTREELKQIESLGGLEKLIEAFRKAREEAEKAEEGENGEDGDEGNANRPGQRGPGGVGRGKKKRPRKSGINDSTRISTTRSNSAPATSRWPCAGCASSPARAAKKSWTWTIRSARRPTTAACSTSACVRSARTPSRSC